MTFVPFEPFADVSCRRQLSTSAVDVSRGRQQSRTTHNGVGAMTTDVRLLPASACTHPVRVESLRGRKSSISYRAEAGTMLLERG